MAEAYTAALLIHLILAIFFIGFVFADVAVLSVLKSKFDTETYKKIKQAISDRSRKIYPPSVLVLILSGGFMLSRYVNSEAGAFETGLQKLLMVKVFLALVIALGIIYSLTTRMLKKTPHPFMAQHFHKVALVLGLGIVILAKMMFVV